ncbi:MAG: hypothetical protein WEB09_09920 [Nitriliruptor sp.]
MRRMRWTRWLIAVLVAAMLPVPWLQGGLRHGASRELALTVEGATVASPGLRYLTVLGYYPLVQAVADQLVHDASGPPTDLLSLDPPDWLRPVVNEPVAAALGLRAAGREVTVWLRMVGVDDAGQHVVVDRFNGRPIRTGQDLVAARRLGPDGGWWFSTTDGRRFDGAPSDELTRVQLRWHTSVTAHTTGGVPFGHVAALREPIRELPVGASHTLMVALTAYSHTVQRPLLPGRVLAGTGELDPLTGAVGRIGGLRLKAEAAYEDGVDVLLYPASQTASLEGLRTPGMRRVPVTSLTDAIETLATL